MMTEPHDTANAPTAPPEIRMVPYGAPDTLVPYEEIDLDWDELGGEGNGA